MTGRGRAGFSLVELMISMVVLGVALAAAGGLFNAILGQFRQQSKITETGIEGVIGLEILRKDLEQAGYGLPWNTNGLGAYNQEALGSARAVSLNDLPNPPRAMVSINNGSPVATFNNSDYVTVKSVVVSGTDTCRRWTTLAPDGTNRVWSPADENLADLDRVIVLAPGNNTGNNRRLMVSGAIFAPTFANARAWPDYRPDAGFVNLVYGIDGSGSRMPFNRADYYIDASNVPSRCAPGTGVLVKAVVSQADGSVGTSANPPLPLLDCVADMQVVFRLDTNGDFLIDDTRDDLTGLNAQEIRDQLQETRVFVLAHEGQVDRGYTSGTASIAVGDATVGPQSTFSLGSLSDPANPLPHYRWRLYSLTVKMNTLR